MRLRIKIFIRNFYLEYYMAMEFIIMSGPDYLACFLECLLVKMQSK